MLISRSEISPSPGEGWLATKHDTLPKFNIAPENRPNAKRKGLSSNHHFSGAMLNFGGVDMANEKTWNARAVDVNLDLVILHFQGLLRRLDCWKT